MRTQGEKKDCRLPEWDEGEQGPGGRGGEWSGGKSEGHPRAPRCRDRNQGGGNRDTGVGVAGEGNRGDHTVRKEWGEKVDPAFDQWAVGDIHDRVVERDEILKVSGSDRNQERLREVAFTMVPITHGEVNSSTVLGSCQRERFREWGLVQEGAG